MKRLEEMGRYATVVIDPPWPINFGTLTPEQSRQLIEKRKAEVGWTSLAAGALLALIRGATRPLAGQPCLTTISKFSWMHRS